MPKRKHMNDGPRGKQVYIPGRLVPAICALVEGYRAGHPPTLDNAIQQLMAAIQTRITPAAMPDSAMPDSAMPNPTTEFIQPVWTMKAPADDGIQDSEIDWVARLNRAAPAIAERYARGEFRTAQEAAFAAGLLTAEPVAPFVPRPTRRRRPTQPA